MGKFFKKCVFFMLFFAVLSVSIPCYAQAGGDGLYVDYHTQQEIREYLKKNKVDISAETNYAKSPSVKAPYKAGELEEKSLQQALDVLNAVRYIAGIGSDVTLDEDYVELAQAAALVNAVNSGLSHYPSQPEGMKESLYELGYHGASSSNLAYTSWKTGLGYSIVNQWMEDGDPGNISVVGHRRWILNPSMAKTGFGLAEGERGTFTAMYVFDSGNEDTGHHGVAWPAQNMPIEYFGNNYPWSISMGFLVHASDVEVTLTRKNDNKKWKFSMEEADGYFNVDNGGYGLPGCIIFRPDDITYSVGDRFHVEIDGLVEDVSYDVNFFRADIEDCSHVYGEPQITQKATLAKNGKETHICSQCGYQKTKTIYKASVLSMSEKSVVYNGKKQQPKVIVEDSKGRTINAKYYSVSYKDEKNPGIAKVTVKLKGKYSGKKVLTFTVKPKRAELSKVQPSKKALRVTWKQNNKITGYQVCYSTDAKFAAKKTKTATVKGQTTLKHTIKDLKSKKTYYVRVRAYKTVQVDGQKKNLYSSWSKVKKVKTL